MSWLTPGVTGGYNFVPPSGGDDTANIQAALNQSAKYPVQLAGIYKVSSPLSLPKQGVLVADNPRSFEQYLGGTNLPPTRLVATSDAGYVPTTFGTFTGQVTPENSTTTASISNASPCVITWTGHGLTNGCPVKFSFATSCGQFTTEYQYFVINATTNTFNLANSVGGTALNNNSAQSNVSMYAQASCLITATLSGFTAPGYLLSGAGIASGTQLLTFLNSGGGTSVWLTNLSNSLTASATITCQKPRGILECQSNCYVRGICVFGTGSRLTNGIDFSTGRQWGLFEDCNAFNVNIGFFGVGDGVTGTNDATGICQGAYIYGGYYSSCKTAGIFGSGSSNGGGGGYISDWIIDGAHCADNSGPGLWLEFYSNSQVINGRFEDNVTGAVYALQSNVTFKSIPGIIFSNNFLDFAFNGNCMRIITGSAGLVMSNNRFGKNNVTGGGLIRIMSNSIQPTLGDFICHGNLYYVPAGQYIYQVDGQVTSINGEVYESPTASGGGTVYADAHTSTLLSAIKH